MKIIAALKLTSPLHISMPDGRRYDVSKDSIVYNKSDATPLISTQILRIVNPWLTGTGAGAGAEQDLPDADELGSVLSPDSAAADEEGDASKENKTKAPPPRVLRVPAIMANNLVGHLRRHAAFHVLDALGARKETVSLPVYSCLQCGAWTGSPDGEDLRYGEFLQAKKHPYLGLFGGGPRMIRRSFQATNAIPAMHALRTALNIPHTVDPMPDLPMNLWTQIAIFRRNDDLADLANLSMAAKTLKDFEASLADYEAALTATGGKRTEDDKKVGSKASSMTFSSMEFVIPGMLFDLSFDLFPDLTDAQIGLFLLSLDRFAQTDTLGGHSRNGFGRFVLESVVAQTNERDEVLPLFSQGKLDRKAPHVAAYLRAWEEAANAMSVKELEYLFRVGSKKEKNKKVDGNVAKPAPMSALEARVAGQQSQMSGGN